MEYQNENNWIALNYVGSSLRDVIGNGTFKQTNLTIAEWKKLLNNSHIQVKIQNQILILLTFSLFLPSDGFSGPKRLAR